MHYPTGPSPIKCPVKKWHVLPESLDSEVPRLHTGGPRQPLAQLQFFLHRRNMPRCTSTPEEKLYRMESRSSYL